MAYKIAFTTRNPTTNTRLRRLMRSLALISGITKAI